MAAIPLVFEGLSIALPAVIGLASAGALLGTLGQTREDFWTRAPSTSVWTNWGSDVGSSPPPPPSPPPPDKNQAMKLAMKMMLAKMLADALEKKKKICDPPVGWCRAAGFLKNDSDQDVLRLKVKHEWCGHFSSDPPSENKRKDWVVHQGGPPKGSKAGVAYQANGYQWLVAWHVPFLTTPHENKIYVEHGPVAQINWNLIEKKLDASSKKCEAHGAMAEITDDNDATIAVVFYQ